MEISEDVMCYSDTDQGIIDRKSEGAYTSVVQEKYKNKRKCGIVYISTLPQYMNVTKIREIFSLYGEVGRVFLQPADRGQGEKKKKKKQKPAKHFTEGWVEFKNKRIAKQVAFQLNNTRIGERKKSKFYDNLWNIKYLPRFKWVHLNERLAYERAVHQQRLRTEIAQAKREANFISHNMERSKKLHKHNNENTHNKNSIGMKSFLVKYHQRKTDKEINQCSEKSKHRSESGKTTERTTEEDRDHFLKNLFGNSV